MLWNEKRSRSSRVKFASVVRNFLIPMQNYSRNLWGNSHLSKNGARLMCQTLFLSMTALKRRFVDTRNTFIASTKERPDDTLIGRTKERPDDTLIGSTKECPDDTLIGKTKSKDPP